MFSEPMTLKELAQQAGWKKHPRSEAAKLMADGTLLRRLVYVDPAGSKKRKVVYQMIFGSQAPLWS